MMHWLIPVMWSYYSVAAWVLQLVGLAGMVAAATALWLRYYRRTLEAFDRKYGGAE